MVRTVFGINRFSGALVILVSALCALGSSQTQRAVKLSADGITGQPFTLSELGAIVVSKNGQLEVLMVMPPQNRPADYRETDLREGDVLLMMNGKKLKSIDDLKNAHEAAEVGALLKFGVKRNDGTHIISFLKADPEDLPVVSTTMTIDEGPDEAGRGMKMMRLDGSEDGTEVAVLVGSGIIARRCEEDSCVAIGMLMPDAADIIGDTAVAVGDRIVSVQGKRIKDLATLSEVFDNVKAGESIVIEIEREGRVRRISFTKRKPESGPGMKVIRN